MNDLAIFAISHERSRWLASRVAVVAANVANADTPGYQAKEIPPFEEALSGARVEMKRTSQSHIVPPGGGAERYGVRLREQGAEKHSGNSVSLDAEMATLGESRGQQASVTGIIGAFHRMLLSSVRSGA